MLWGFCLFPQQSRKDQPSQALTVCNLILGVEKEKRGGRFLLSYEIPHLKPVCDLGFICGPWALQFYQVLYGLMHSNHSIELNNQNGELREGWGFFPPGYENRVQVQHPHFPRGI